MSRQSFGQDQRVFCRNIMSLCCDRVGQARSFHSRQNVFMLRQSWEWWRGFMSRQNILYRDRVWPNGEALCCDRAILCRNIVGQAGKILCRD